MSASTKLASSAAVLAALDEVLRTPPELDGSWSLPQVFVHCAQSVELSLTGYPSPRGWLVRRVIGPCVRPLVR